MKQESIKIELTDVVQITISSKGVDAALSANLFGSRRAANFPEVE